MATPTGPTAGKSTVLVVDDEPALLALVRTMLWRAGYTVLEASNAEEALRIAGAADQPIDLLLSDVVMPEVNGYELAERLLAQRPEVKVLHMSGYTDQALMESTGRRSAAPLLRKPFTAYKLVTKISEILENPVSSN